MRALVAGGAGFIGSALVDRLLAEGHAVDVVDDLSAGSLANLAEARAVGGALRFTQLEIRSGELPAVVGRARPDVVYHLATAPPPPTPSGPVAPASQVAEHAAMTVQGALAVLEASRQAGVSKVVVALSPALYGRLDAGDLPVRESQARRPLSPGGATEAAVAGYLDVYRERHGIEHSALVLGDVYGPRQDPHADAASVASIVSRVSAGQPVALAGGGGRARDLVFVDDVVDALARAAGRGGGLILNIGTGLATTAAEVHAAVVRAVGTDPGTTAGGFVADEPARVALDAGRAAIHLGWAAWTPLDDGIVATVASAGAGGGRDRR